MTKPSRSPADLSAKTPRKRFGHGLLQKVEKLIIANRLFEPGGRILIAVSGGPDSMALFSLLDELRPKWNLDLYVLYCHHGLRAAADEEEVFVRDWSEKIGIPFISRRLPVRDYHKESGKSLQEAARLLRYRIFEEERNLAECDHIALAHTANDQAEEVLIGLIRGAGLGGLTGMPLKRGPFIRPLLKIFRSEILQYLEQKEIPYKEDASNADIRFLRARIRHHLLGELKGYSPNILNQLNQMAALLQKDEEYLQKQVCKMMRSIVSHSGATTRLERAKLLALPQALAARVIQRVLLERMGNLDHIRSVHILSLLKPAEGSAKVGRISLPNGWSAVWDRESLTIVPDAVRPGTISPFSFTAEKPGLFCIPETGEVVSFIKAKAVTGVMETTEGKDIVRVDFDRITWPLVVRNLRPGDRFQPLGLGGSKKVSRFFIDRRVPVERRSRIPLICSGGEIVWIAGLEIGHPFRLTSQTVRILEMTYGKEKEG